MLSRIIRAPLAYIIIIYRKAASTTRHSNNSHSESMLRVAHQVNAITPSAMTKKGTTSRRASQNERRMRCQAMHCHTKSHSTFTLMKYTTIT